MDDELHDLIGAYAMDALDPGERTAFKQHLATCTDCQDELVGLSDALADLSADYEVEPPPALRAAVLSAVAALSTTAAGNSAPNTDASGPRPENTPTTEPEPTALPRNTEATAGADPSGSEGAVDDDTAPATVTPLRPRSDPRSGRSRWQLLVAAAIALVAVIGISVWQPWAQRTVTAADVLAAPDAVRATQAADGGGIVTLVRSNQLGRAVLVTQDLVDPPAGKAHQAWLQEPGGSMVSGGMMPSGPDVTVLLEGDARNTVGAGISVEPPGGSRKPSDQIVVLIVL